MKKQIAHLVIILLLLGQGANAQSFDSLKHLTSPVAKIYFSTGHDEQAFAIARQINGAYTYFANLLNFKPEVILLVLDPGDWKKFASPQAVYGMPHFNSNMKTLYVAAEDNAFWKSFLPPLDKINPVLAQEITTTYKNENGDVSMRGFFDMLALHELGHAFHLQKGINMQRNWMSEVFVNILLHTYIAEKEPALLPALTLFPKMVIGGGSSEFTFTTLKDVHEKYQEIAMKHPKNYGWYQCRWHEGAAKIYNAAGKNVGKKIWLVLQNLKVNLSDKELASVMKTKVHTSVFELISNWDDRTVKLANKKP